MSHAILLINIGSPTEPTPSAVKTYLRHFLSDRRVIKTSPWIWQPLLNLAILPKRAPHSAALYQEIWTDQGSPLVTYTEQQAQQLQAYFPNAIVRFAMMYSQPTIEEVLDEFQALGITHLTVLPLYPQYSGTTTGSAFDRIVNYYQSTDQIVDLHFIRHFYQHPQWVHYYAKMIVDYLTEHPANELLLFSYHSLPISYIDDGDPYLEECQQATDLIIEVVEEKLDRSVNYAISFQSKFGPQKWLGPQTIDQMQSLPQQGIKDIAVVAPSFVADCLETLHELEIENKEMFLQSGGERFDYLPAPNGSQQFTQLLADLIQPS